MTNYPNFVAINLINSLKISHKISIGVFKLTDVIIPAPLFKRLSDHNLISSVKGLVFKKF